MHSIKQKLTKIITDAFEKNGFDKRFGEVTVSDRPDLCQFQCNGALAAAKIYKINPLQIAKMVVEGLVQNSIFSDVSIANPGFINFKLNDDYLANHIDCMSLEQNLGAIMPDKNMKIIVDYGGANVGKPLHIGHVRTAIIGESLKRIARFLGHKVIGDAHLGDWGRQMGMIINELKFRNPSWNYFDENYTGPYSEESPITIEDFEEIYPSANVRAKSDESIMEESRKATLELHQGRPGYRALWKHFMEVSKKDLVKDYEKLFTEFDLWLGESDSHDIIPEMVKYLNDNCYTYESDGALVIDVSENTDEHEIPPFMVYKSDGSALYGTTDLATIMQRKNDMNPDAIWYVVDNRQAMHFKQVFRCAYKTKIVSESTSLEHLGFGTMNGNDGKPFKTRDGGVMKLKDLIKMVEDKALEKIVEAKAESAFDEAEMKEIAHLVGVAVLKFADLLNHRLKDYVFDLDRFSSFEGKTGTYLLYSTVRIKSIIRKAKESNFEIGKISSATSETERELQLKLSEFPEIINKVFNDRAPSQLCEFGFELAAIFSKFYHDHRILTEENFEKRSSWLGLLNYTGKLLEKVQDLLGIKVPERL